MLGHAFQRRTRKPRAFATKADLMATEARLVRYTRSIASAMPCPTPMHIVASA
jgi:hypothetical protein